MNNEWIKDQGILPRLGFSTQLDPSRIEDINNLLNNLKQYREFADTSSPDWRDYVLSIFHLFGFQTIWREQRLVTIGEIGNPDVPLATVVILNPYEDMFQAANGLAWGAYLFYAGKHFKTRWGIIINGQKMKMFDLQSKEFDANRLFVDLDEILLSGSKDMFSIVYFALMSIKGRTYIAKKPNQSVPSKNVNAEIKYKLFEALITEFKQQRPGFTNAKKTSHTYMTFGSGKSNVLFQWRIKELKLNIQIILKNPDLEKNEQWFEELFAQREMLEAEIGYPFDWEQSDETKNLVIRIVSPFEAQLCNENFEDNKNWGVKMMIRIVDTFRPRILKLDN